jgi:hypothetical protein
MLFHLAIQFMALLQNIFRTLQSFTPLLRFTGRKKQGKINDIPASVLYQIFGHLNDTDLKSLSLTSCMLFDYCETTRQLLPLLRTTYPRSTYQVRYAERVLPEGIPSRYTPYNPDTDTEPLVPYLLRSNPLRDTLPSYYQSMESAYEYAFRVTRNKRPTTSQIWLCPHIGFTANEFSELHRGCSIVDVGVKDTTPALCLFPKCALWARHAIVNTVTNLDADLVECCSVIKICRYYCPTFADTRSILSEDQNLDRLRRAMQKLQLDVCSHLRFSSESMMSSYDPQFIPIFNVPEVSTASMDESIRKAMDKSHCADCPIRGTYTTWGFVARYIARDGENWLDVELMLCRPLDIRRTNVFARTPDGDYRSIEVKGEHWKQHSVQPEDMALFVKYWWDWAEVVAEGGFDWRAKLPPQFLRRCRSSLLNFPVHPTTKK